MEFVNLPLLAVSGMVFASVLVGLFSTRIGFSFLLVFLLAGEDGVGGFRFDDYRLSFWVGNLAVAATLILVARPLVVWICLRPFRFSANETWFISWVGLRGAVPIVLALFPLMAGTPQANVLFNIAFLVVVTSLLLQGSTIGWMARRLGVAMPESSDERHQRAVFRDFVLEAATPVGVVCEFYSLPAPEPAEANLPLGDWMALQLRRPPVAGDSVALGPATFVVRELADGRISRIGLGLAS